MNVPKYRKKEEIVEVLYCGARNLTPMLVAEWCGGEVIPFTNKWGTKLAVNVPTRSGNRIALESDIIVRDSSGEFEVFRDDEEFWNKHELMSPEAWVKIDD